MFCRSTSCLAKPAALAPLRVVNRTLATLYPAEIRLSDKPRDVGKKDETAPQARMSRSLQALHLRPMKHEPEYGIPSCDLQLRSFSLQPLEFFSDFALRAAYYLGLPASGPIPLPRITERWTVPRSHFIFKKSQENFERVTLRRMIQIKDGNPETVQLWLAYLRKHQYFGVGMKANVWEFGPAGEDKSIQELKTSDFEDSWAHLGQTRNLNTVEKVDEILNRRRFKEAAGLRQSFSIEENTT